MGCSKVKHNIFYPLDNLMFHPKTSYSPIKFHASEMLKMLCICERRFLHVLLCATVTMTLHIFLRRHSLGDFSLNQRFICDNTVRFLVRVSIFQVNAKDTCDRHQPHVLLYCSNISCKLAERKTIFSKI